MPTRQRRSCDQLQERKGQNSDGGHTGASAAPAGESQHGSVHFQLDARANAQVRPFKLFAFFRVAALFCFAWDG